MAYQAKIRDNQGNIYTVSEELTSDTTVDISSFTKIKHPNLFIDMQSAYSYTQFIALFRIVELLQPVIKNNFQCKGNILTIQSRNVYWNKETRMVEIVLPLRDFGVSPGHYVSLENALVGMGNIKVTFPEKSALTNNELIAIGGLCHVAVERRNKRRENVHFFFREQIIQTIINPFNGFTQILKETVEKINSIYTAKLYFNICRRADIGYWRPSYIDLRSILNIDDNKYLDYLDFRKRILKSSERALMNQTNCWFTFHERFPANSRTPNIIYFKIYNRALSEQENRDHKSRVDRIKDICIHLGMTTRTTSSILSKITPGNSQYCYKKSNELLAYVMDHESEINNRAAYYRQAMQNIILNQLYDIPATQQQLNFPFK